MAATKRHIPEASPSETLPDRPGYAALRQNPTQNIQLRTGDDLEDVFIWKEERTLSHALTLQCDQVIFILEPRGQARAAIGKRITVVDHPDGRMSNGRDSDLPIWWRHDSGAYDAVEQTAGLLVGQQQLPVLG